MSTSSRTFAAGQPERHGRESNVGDLERWASVLGGGALALFGLARRSLPGLGLAALGGALVQRGVTGHCHVYQALGLSTAEPERAPATSVPARQGVKVEKSFTINRPAADLYRFWRNFENLPRFMKHLEAVQMRSDERSHWVARGPLGTNVEWDAEIINERPNEMIAWRSLEGADVDTAGSVHFREAPGGRGTEMRVILKYDPPGGKLGALVAKLFGQAPEQQIQEDLRRFQQIMETGEIRTAQGQPEPVGTLEPRRLVEQASEDSFPASDAPAWTSGRS